MSDLSWLETAALSGVGFWIGALTGQLWLTLRAAQKWFNRHTQP